MTDTARLDLLALSKDVVELAAAGDRAAFELIVERYHPDVFQVAFVVTQDGDVAEQAAAATWSRAWRQLAKLRDHGRLRSWLVAIAANEARRVARRERSRRVAEIPMDTPGPLSADPSTLVAELDLADALGHLSPDDRALVPLRYIAGLDSRELGRALGLSPSGVRARLARLLIQLRKVLSDE
jgi:RNA polymerase sigma-70 factor, ECF subfamily